MFIEKGFSWLSSFFIKDDTIPFDEKMLSSIETTLLEIDILPETAKKIMQPLTSKLGSGVSADFLVSTISYEMLRMLRPHGKPMEIDPSCKPQVVLVCGINGAGKTSTIAKMAYGLTKHNWHVTVGACDTFRSAASAQLKTMLDKYVRHNLSFICQSKETENPSSVACNAYQAAKKESSDVLIIDTAGRIYSHANLMEELCGVARTLKKKDPAAPHNIVMILDGSTGKDAIRQVTEFSKIGNISGIIITKLDGQARCGIVLSIVDKFGIPIHGISAGENIDDLHDFVPENFVKMLLKVRS